MSFIIYDVHIISSSLIIERFEIIYQEGFSFHSLSVLKLVPTYTFPTNKLLSKYVGIKDIFNSPRIQESYSDKLPTFYGVKLDWNWLEHSGVNTELAMVIEYDWQWCSTKSFQNRRHHTEKHEAKWTIMNLEHPDIHIRNLKQLFEIEDCS